MKDKNIEIECINFADYILLDYEIIADENDDLKFELAGTKQRYTSKELYDRYLNYKNKTEY